MSEIRANQLTKLIFTTDDGSEKELNCSIQKVYKDRLSLNFTKEALDCIDYLQEGSDVDVKIFTPSGIKMYSAIVLNSPLESEFVIEFVQDYIKEVQRRKYLRADFNTKVIILTPKDGNIVTYTYDIGGGGIRFNSGQPLKEGDTVDCMLYIPPVLQSIKARGLILKDKHLTQNEYVLMFLKIDERDRDKIIKKCLEIEAEQYKEL